jgi:hypothetical protein
MDYENRPLDYTIPTPPVQAIIAGKARLAFVPGRFSDVLTYGELFLRGHVSTSMLSSGGEKLVGPGKLYRGSEFSLPESEGQ